MRYFLLLLCLSFIYVFYEGLKKDPTVLPSNLISKEIPNFSIKNTEGKQFTGENLKNEKIKIVNFFASWCPPCRIEHKQLMYLSKKIPVYGIAKKNKKKDLKIWLDNLGNPFRIIGMDYEGLTSIEWGVYGLPETFIIDKNNVIKYRHVGPIMEKDLQDIVKIIDDLK